VNVGLQLLSVCLCMCGLNTDRAFVIKSFELPKKLCFRCDSRRYNLSVQSAQKT
jgi:hypothetical protein